MSTVTSLDFAAPEAATPAHRRVRRASRLFGGLFTALFWLLAALAALMALALLFYAGPHLQATPHAFELTEHDRPLKDAVIVGTLPLATKAAYAATAIVRTLPALMIFWNLRALFRLYAAGQVFSAANSAAIKRIGLWLIAAAFDPFLCHLALSAAGREIDRSWFHLQEVQALVLGGLVFVIAQVMQVGREIEDERSQFV